MEMEVANLEQSLVLRKPNPEPGILHPGQGNPAYRKTPYQELMILDTLEFGRTLVLDGAIKPPFAMSLYTTK